MKKNLLLLIAFTCIGWNVKAQTSWVTLNSGTTANLYCIQFLDANNGFAGGGGNGIATVIKTIDGGSTWSPINIGSNMPVRGIYFINTDSGWAVTGDPNSYTTSGTIWFTATGGSTWNSVSWPGSPYANLSVQVNSGTVWIGATHSTSGTGQDVYYSTDNGSTWTGNPANIDWIWQYGLHFNDATHGWVTGDNQTNGLINYTADGGTSWTQRYSSTNFLYGINFANDLTGFACGDHGTLLKTINGGSAWNPVTTNLGSDTLYGITESGAILWLVVGTSGSTLWSLNGGSSWITGPPTPTTTNLYSVTSAPNGGGAWFWACGDGGVIIKNDIYEGIPDVNNSKTAFSIYPNPSNGIINLSSINSQTLNLNSQLVISDIMGREVYHQFVNVIAQSSINVSDLNDGIYFWEVKSTNGTLDKGKLTILK